MHKIICAYLLLFYYTRLYPLTYSILSTYCHFSLRIDQTQKMEEPLINEILLVCSALGAEETIVTKKGEMQTRFVRGEQCLEWLQDLQR